jgi:hypothetical protein
VQMTTKKRPPTSLGTSQGRHTVAWEAKTRYWSALLAGGTYRDAIDTLEALAVADEAVDALVGGAPEAQKLRGQLLTELQGLGDDARLDESGWIEKLTWAVTTYVKTYQLSSAAAFASKKPAGRGEATALKELGSVSDQLAAEEKPTRTVTQKPKGKGKARKAEVDVGKDDVMAWARGLIDLSASLPKPILHKAFKDWLAMLTTLYPELFEGTDAMLKTPEPEQVDSILTDGYQKVLDLFKLMGGSEWAAVSTPPTTAAPAPDDDDDEEGVALDAETDDPLLRETEPFLVRLTTKQAAAGAVWDVADLQVTRLVISDERPPTRFNNRQMSHTIPWSLERLAWARAFTGTLEEVLEQFAQRVRDDEAWSVATVTPKYVATARTTLLEEIEGLGGKWSIPEWTNWLNDAIERYVAAYQASSFAAYATEPTSSGDSTARGRGEAANIRQMLAWEELLDRIAAEKQAAASKDPEELEDDDEMKVASQPPPGSDVQAVAAQLVDVPELDANRDSVGIDTLKQRWIEELRTVFPLVVQGYEKEIGAAFDEEAVPSERAVALNTITSASGPQTRKRGNDKLKEAVEALATAPATDAKRRKLKAKSSKG